MNTPSTSKNRCSISFLFLLFEITPSLNKSICFVLSSLLSLEPKSCTQLNIELWLVDVSNISSIFLEAFLYGKSLTKSKAISFNPGDCL